MPAVQFYFILFSSAWHMSLVLERRDIPVSFSRDPERRNNHHPKRTAHWYNIQIAVLFIHCTHGEAGREQLHVSSYILTCRQPSHL